MFKDEQINYANYLRNKPQETDIKKLTAMYEALEAALRARDVHGHISATYYTDWHILVNVDGEYYGVFDCVTGKFLSGFVGD